MRACVPAFALVVLVPAVARAEGEADVRLADAPSADESNERHGLVVFNVAGLFAARIGFDFAAFVAPHVAPTGSLHAQATYFPTADSTAKALSGFGGELGVRLYASARRPSGAFVGVYAVGGRYFASRKALDFDDSTSITSFGGALDVGWSYVSRSNVIIAAGAGIEYRFAQSEPNADVGEVARWFASDGAQPRVLLQVGRFF